MGEQKGITCGSGLSGEEKKVDVLLIFIFKKKKLSFCRKNPAQILFAPFAN